jgi:hypothetical protein
VIKRYSGGGNGTGIREHILMMSYMNSKLKPMDLHVKDEFLVHLIFASLPKEFDTIVVNYNIQPEKWDLDHCMDMCVQEEERMKAANGGTLHYVKDIKKINFNANANSPAKAKGKAPQHHQPQQKKFMVNKDQCLHCKKTEHYKKDCPEFLKSIMAKNGENIIMFINESLYVQYSKSTWRIDSGATIHVANSLQGFRSTRTMQRKERHIKVANGVQADVEAIGDLPLELANGFILVLRDVLYVPSLHRNLISVSCLDNDGFDFHFGDGKCEIFHNKESVGLAFQKEDLYLLSLHENVNSISDMNENVPSSMNENRKRKRTPDASSKLWHCRLGHISRGNRETS